MSTYDSKISRVGLGFSEAASSDGPTSHDDSEVAPVVKNAEGQRIRLAAVACFVLRKVDALSVLRAKAEAGGRNDLKSLIDGLIERAGK